MRSWVAQRNGTKQTKEVYKAFKINTLAFHILAAHINVQAETLTIIQI